LGRSLRHLLLALLLLARLNNVGSDRSCNRCCAVGNCLDLDALVRRVLTDAIDLERSGEHSFFGVELDRKTVFGFYVRDFTTFLVEGVDRHLGGHTHVEDCGALPLGFFLQSTQQAQRRGLDGPHDALSTTMRTGHRRPGDDAGAQPLSRHFEKSELADLADLYAGAIVLYAVAQALFDIAIIARVLHVDEIDDNETRKIAQT